MAKLTETQIKVEDMADNHTIAPTAVSASSEDNIDLAVQIAGLQQQLKESKESQEKLAAMVESLIQGPNAATGSSTAGSAVPVTASSSAQTLGIKRERIKEEDDGGTGRRPVASESHTTKRIKKEPKIVIELD